jgi:hypothetical protein
VNASLTLPAPESAGSGTITITAVYDPSRVDSHLLREGVAGISVVCTSVVLVGAILAQDIGHAVGALIADVGSAAAIIHGDISDIPAQGEKKRE